MMLLLLLLLLLLSLLLLCCCCSYPCCVCHCVCLSCKYCCRSYGHDIHVSCIFSLFPLLARSPWLYIFRLYNIAGLRLQAHAFQQAVEHRWHLCLVSFQAKEGARNVFLSSRRSPNPCSFVAASSLLNNSFERNCCNRCRRDHDNSSSVSIPSEIL